MTVYITALEIHSTYIMCDQTRSHYLRIILLQGLPFGCNWLFDNYNLLEPRGNYECLKKCLYAESRIYILYADDSKCLEFIVTLGFVTVPRQFHPVPPVMITCAKPF
jgi:hypothetical protein